jgi:hypothetical protein
VVIEFSRCAYAGCDKKFESTRHNQKYCTEECSRKANNEKILKRYHERRARLSGNVRVCAEMDCDTRLSRYNPDTICNKCQRKKKDARRKQILDSLGL